MGHDCSTQLYTICALVVPVYTCVYMIISLFEFPLHLPLAPFPHESALTPVTSHHFLSSSASSGRGVVHSAALPALGRVHGEPTRLLLQVSAARCPSIQLVIRSLFEVTDTNRSDATQQ